MSTYTLSELLALQQNLEVVKAKMQEDRKWFADNKYPNWPDSERTFDGNVVQSKLDAVHRQMMQCVANIKIND